MVALQKSACLKQTSNTNWIGDVPGKAGLPPSEKRKTAVKFCQGSLKKKQSARPSRCLSETRTLGRRVMRKSPKRFDLLTLILPTRPNTGSETGRAAAAHRPGKRLAASLPELWPPTFCENSILKWKSSLTRRK